MTFMVINLQGVGQIATYEEQLQFEINRRGISEEEFRELLLDAGVDPDALDQLDASELLKVKELIEDFERERFFRQRNLSGADTSDVDEALISEDSIEILTPDTLPIEEDSLSEVIFGHQFFDSEQLSLIPSSLGFDPPETYVLGVGDAISVSIFGSARVEDSHVIQQDGSVRILEGNVKVTLAGLEVQDARIKLERAYRREYRFSPNQFSMYVNAVRTIRISVSGEVGTPGDYTISALNGIPNVLAAAGGLTGNGTVRNIQLIKRSGKAVNFDLYEFLNHPDPSKSFNLENGDYILVRAAYKVVSISGAVNRPHFYELKDSEGLFELIEFAGGLAGNANLGSITVNRFEGDRRVVKDVAYAERVKSNRDFDLIHGDEVLIRHIDEVLENFVSVTGEVRNQGNYEFVEGLTLKDVLLLAGVKPSTKMDFALLRRISSDGSVNIFNVSPEDALNDIGQSALFLMEDQDELIIWPKERFIDNKYIKIAGAVRVPEQFEFDEAGSLRAFDLINLAGGLRSDAAAFAFIHRLDPLNPNEKKYIKLDINRMLADPNSADNVFLEPYDSLYVHSKNEFNENLYIRVSGAVNNPGSFIYGDGMTIKDAILLAGGFKRSSSTNAIEVSRVVFEDNESTKTTIHKIALDRRQLNAKGDNDFVLEPYDNVFVRHVPQFELQQNVVIEGEVVFPGEYSLIKDNETVFDIIKRAGGLTQEAFPGAAKLFRSKDSTGFIVMRLDDALIDQASRYNYTLMHGDTITIPTNYNYVKIFGATQYLTQNEETQLTVPFHEGKDALFYIDNYGGGFADDARTDKVLVKYPNGEIKTSKKRFLFGKKYPEVLPGSEIRVWTIQKNLRNVQDKEEVNWTRVLGDSVAQAMSILTLILLIQRLD